MVHVTSVDNPLVRRLRRLVESPRACRESRRTVAEGVHLVESALTAQIPLTAVVLRDGATDAIRALADRAAAANQTRVVELARPLYDAISPVEHGAGVLVELEPVERALPDSVTADAVYLDGVQDPGNAGTLLRTAAAAGIGHVAASPGTAFLWAPKVMRAAMGAHFALRIYEDVAPDRLREAFAGERLAADGAAAESLFDAAWGVGPTLWMFGSEGLGLSAPAMAAAEQRLAIPLASAVESLNVAAAAAVCLFEQRRRRSAYI
jgi:TrmH family RNA methyltransferase